MTPSVASTSTSSRRCWSSGATVKTLTSVRTSCSVEILVTEFSFWYIVRVLILSQYPDRTQGAMLPREDTGRGREHLENRVGYELKRAQHSLRLRMDEALKGPGVTTPRHSARSSGGPSARGGSGGTRPLRAAASPRRSTRR